MMDIDSQLSFTVLVELILIKVTALLDINFRFYISIGSHMSFHLTMRIKSEPEGDLAGLRQL